MSSQSVIVSLMLQLFVLQQALVIKSSGENILEKTLTNSHEILMRDILMPLMMDYRPGNENGTSWENKMKAMHDRSNDNIGTFMAKQIITRSGFEQENHYVLSDDGYVTNLLRIINPKADRTKLKQPPVVITHGGIIDYTAYLWSSSIQHWPEPWPRKPSDPPMTSSNRSLAFMLANNGYDVWLVGTRGSNLMNEGHVRYRAFKPIGRNFLEKLNQVGLQLSHVKDTLSYFDFSMDEIMKYEMPRQIQKVLDVTGAEKISWMSFSFSTMMSFPLFSMRPDIARRIHQHITMAPIINNKGANPFLKALQKLCVIWPTNVGIFSSDYLLTHPYPDIMSATFNNYEYRYLLIKLANDLISGPTAKYTSQLESPVIWHILVSTGFKEVKHYCQQARAGNLQRYDYGKMKNLALYQRAKPPVHDITISNINNWMMIYGLSDNLATPASAQQFYDTVIPKPKRRIGVKGYGHIDLVCAMDNDIKVNLPILDYLDEYHLPPSPWNMTAEKVGVMKRALEQNLELEKYVPGTYALKTDGRLANWA